MASNDSFLKFRADIRQLAAGISGRLPEHVNAMIRDELEYGLYDMATTDIAATLMREKVPVTREERDTLQRVLFCFRTPMEYYPFITHREDVLASLVVRDAPDRGTPLASIAAHLPGW
uniref:hypothetical protein n=1 Tax=Nocardia sp. CNY236 TaxID=1169152 RepID=UPI00048F431F